MELEVLINSLLNEQEVQADVLGQLGLLADHEDMGGLGLDACFLPGGGSGRIWFENEFMGLGRRCQSHKGQQGQGREQDGADAGHGELLV